MGTLKADLMIEAAQVEVAAQESFQASDDTNYIEWLKNMQRYLAEKAQAAPEE